MARHSSAISASTQAAIRRLERWALTFEGPGPEGDLQTIKSSAEWRAIPYLMFMSVGASPAEVQARSCVKLLLTNVPELGFKDLDMAIRTELLSDSVDRLRRWPIAWSFRCRDWHRTYTFPEALAGPLASHPNGHVREAAVRMLADRKHGDGVPFLILRANDWVHPVAIVAQNALAKRLKSDRFGDILRYFKLAQDLKECGREDHASFVTRLRQRLLSKPGLRWVAGQFQRCSPQSLREITRTLAQAEGGETVEALKRILGGSDAPSRILAAGGLIKQGMTSKADGVLEVMVRDPNASLRAMAWRTILQSAVPFRSETMRPALFDSSRTVRWVAICALREFGEDPANLYRQEISRREGTALIPAILGLGECGEATDAKLLRPRYEQQEAPKVLAAIVSAIGQLDLMGHQTLFRSALRHDWSSVSRAAADTLKRSTDPWSIDNLPTLVADPRRHVARNALFLISKLGQWSELEGLLIAINRGLPEIADIALRRADGWPQRFVSGWAYPTPNQRKRLGVELSGVERKLSQSLLRQIHFLLQPDQA